jgi:hypothetical protein
LEGSSYHSRGEIHLASHFSLQFDLESVILGGFEGGDRESHLAKIIAAGRVFLKQCDQQVRTLVSADDKLKSLIENRVLSSLFLHFPLIFLRGQGHNRVGIHLSKRLCVNSQFSLLKMKFQSFDRLLAVFDCVKDGACLLGAFGGGRCVGARGAGEEKGGEVDFGLADVIFGGEIAL